MSDVHHNASWSAIGYAPIRFYPFGIGLGFLLPLDSLLKLVLLLFWKAQLVISGAGWYLVPRFPYILEQSFGAYMGIARSRCGPAADSLGRSA